MLRKSKKKSQTRNPRVEYKKQQSYHYSSRRSVSDRTLNRQEVALDGEKTKDTNVSFVKKIPTYLSIILVGIGVYYLLTLSTKPNIIVVNSNAKTQLISKDILQKKAESELKKSLLNRFKPAFNEQKLESALLDLSPEITSVEVTSDALKHNPQIRVEFSEPSLLLSTGTNLYVVGSSGKVLADITKSKEGFNVTSLPLVQDNSNIEIKIGKIALTSDQVDYMKQIKYQTDQKQISTSTMTIVAGGSQLDVKYGGLNYYVKYNFFEDPRLSSGVFLATKEKLERDGKNPAEYIDVRVQERAYIK